jgi:small-conductance mechanosensitive channel
MAVIDFAPDSLFARLTENLNHLMPLVINALVTALAGFVIIRVISWIASWLLGFVRMPRGLRGIVISLLDALLTVFLIIVVLRSLGLNDLALAFTAGVAALGIALGNGSVTLVTDVIAGIYLARDRDFGLGDLVRAGDSGVEGVISSMDMRRTRITDQDGYVHSIPNSVIERKEFILIAKKKDR